ncbi:MAG: class II aldolase/adducin family protein [Gemmatimonadetes bacterium]|nr:class II aldolase/adducin family protein [Gemmatimonadota bacterium]
MTTTLPATFETGEACAAEGDLRVQLAAAYRIFDHLGWCELIYGHISMRVPGPEHHFLINPYGLRYDEITASSLVKIDLDGNLVEPSEYSFNPAGFVIHSAIHEHREDAHCVMHTHTRAGMAIAALECGLLPVSMNGMSFHGNLAYHDFEGSTLLLEEREKLAADLGSADALILRNHGLLSVGRTIAEAFLYLYRLESACRVQIDAMACGRLQYPPQEAVERSARQMREFARCAADTGQLEFDALVRLVEAKDPSFRG